MCDFVFILIFLLVGGSGVFCGFSSEGFFFRLAITDFDD